MRRRGLGNRRSGEQIPTEPNLFVGEVATVVSSVSILASKLEISEANILEFTIIGNNIEAIINTLYNVPYPAWRASNMRTMTYFKDIGGFCDSVLAYAFQDDTNLKEVILPNANRVDNYAFRRCYSSELIYIPNATIIGISIFEDIKPGTTIVCHPSLQTSNSGGRDANIAYAEDTRGAIIIYGEDETLIT